RARHPLPELSSRPNGCELHVLDELRRAVRLSSRAGLSLLVTGPLCLLGCRAELASDLDEAQAAAVVLALDEAGIGAEKSPSGGADRGRFRVSVAREDVAAGLAVLRDRDLPREPAPGMAEL